MRRGREEARAYSLSSRTATSSPPTEGGGGETETNRDQQDCHEYLLVHAEQRLVPGGTERERELQ